MAAAFSPADPHVSFRLASQATWRPRASAQRRTRAFFAPDDPSARDANDRDWT